MAGFPRRRRGELVSSHLISELELMADQLVVIGRGRLLASTSVRELAARAGSLEEAFFGLTDDAVQYRAAESGRS
jgi:ABC-2 type transport system ATP-binding protein